MPRHRSSEALGAIALQEALDAVEAAEYAMNALKATPLGEAYESLRTAQKARDEAEEAARVMNGLLKASDLERTDILRKLAAVEDVSKSARQRAELAWGKAAEKPKVIPGKKGDAGKDAVSICDAEFALVDKKIHLILIREDCKRIDVGPMPGIQGTTMRGVDYRMSGGGAAGSEPRYISTTISLIIPDWKERIIVLADATAAPISLTLPPLANRKAAADVTVIRKNVSGSSVTVFGAGTDAICGSTDGLELNYARVGNTPAIEFTPLGDNGWWMT